MPAAIHLIADAITEFLQSKSLGVPAVIERLWIPDFPAKDFKDTQMRMVVVPVETPEPDRETRGSIHRFHTVDVGVLRKVRSSRDTNLIDEVVDLSDRIADLLDDADLGLAHVRITNAYNFITLDQKRLMEDGIVISLVRVTVLESRTRD